MKFSLLLQQRPISLNSRSNAKYQVAVAQKATREMGDREMMQGRMRARIIWFHVEPTTQDADNIVKPILDALKGVVYQDDFQIGECYVSRIDVNQLYSNSDCVSP